MIFNVENSEGFLQPMAREPIRFLHLTPTGNRQNNCSFNRFLPAFEPRNMGIYGRFHDKTSYDCTKFSDIVKFPKSIILFPSCERTGDAAEL